MFLSQHEVVLKPYKTTGNYLLHLQTQLPLLWKSELNRSSIQYHDLLTLVHWTKLLLTGLKYTTELGFGEVSNKPLNP